jgi:hypothetical protein
MARLPAAAIVSLRTVAGDDLDWRDLGLVARAGDLARLQLSRSPASGSVGLHGDRRCSAQRTVWLASGSIWPSAIAHGCVNAVAGLGVLLVAAGHPVDNASTGLTGWTGWIVMILVIAGLVVTKRFPVRDV